MSRSTTPAPGNLDELMQDPASLFSTGSNSMFLAAFPRSVLFEFENDPSANHDSLNLNRRMVPEEPDESDIPASTGSSGSKSKDKSAPDSDSSGSTKNKPSDDDENPGDKPTEAPKKSTPAESKPGKKPADDSINLKKPDSSGPRDPADDSDDPVTPTLPDGVIEKPKADTGNLGENPDADDRPTGPYETDDSDSDYAHDVPDTSPPADYPYGRDDLLTGGSDNDVIGERMNTYGKSGTFAKVRDFFSDILGGIFPDKAPEIPSTPNYIPAVLPPPRNPQAGLLPVDSFRAGYISQRDLETALGREDWTMCCAATFVYAVQSKYPGLDRNDIMEAAGNAANQPLADGSGACVSPDGYVSSVYQYSQALSRNLGLKDYVDTPGRYTSIEAARKDGVELMKVELSGTVDDDPQEHHVLQIGDQQIDPIPGDGIDGILDAGTKKVENVTALQWYQLP